jgi:hypothetical protein
MYSVDHLEGETTGTFSGIEFSMMQLKSLFLRLLYEWMLTFHRIQSSLLDFID